MSQAGVNNVGGGGGIVTSVTGTANQVTAAPTTGAVVLSTPVTFIAPGSIAATTTLTAVLGNITAVSGNLVLPATTSTVGQIIIGSGTFLHSFGVGNFFGGGSNKSGNFTLTGINNNIIGNNSATTLTSGTNNCALGSSTLSHVTTGSANISIGGSGLNITTGSNNVCIGFAAGNAYASSESNNIVISTSTSGTVGESNTIRIGQFAIHTTCFLAGIAGVSIANAAPVFINTSTGQLGSGPAAFITNWTDVTGASQTIAVNSGYLSDRAGAVAFALPATAPQFSVFRIVGVQGSWTLSQAAGQQILIGSAATTVGVTGSLASTNAGDSIECIASTGGASTVWRVMSFVGNITVA